jgi:hypothetical protein
MVSAVGVLVARRRRRRYDPVRAASILWGTWLVLHLVAFSDGVYLNSYYTAALTPAIAALCGVGLSLVWRATGAERVDPSGPGAVGTDEEAGDEAPGYGWTGRALVGVVVSAGAGYAVYLIPTGTGVRPWLVPAVIAAAVVTDVALLASIVRRPDAAGIGSIALVAAVAAALLVPSVASATAVTDGLGPFDTPFEPASVTLVTQTDVRRAQD